MYVLQTKCHIKISKQAPCIKIKHVSIALTSICVNNNKNSNSPHIYVKAAVAPWRQQLRYPYIAISWVSYEIWIAYQKISKQILQTIS